MHQGLLQIPQLPETGFAAEQMPVVVLMVVLMMHLLLLQEFLMVVQMADGPVDRMEIQKVAEAVVLAVFLQHDNIRTYRTSQI